MRQVATGGLQSLFRAGRIDLARVGMLALATAVQAARAASFRLRLARN